MSGPELIKQLIKALNAQQTASEDAKVDAASLTRCFAVGVSLLSMEYDVADRMNQSKSRLVSSALHQDRVVAMMASLESLLVLLWSSLIRVQTDSWLELSQRVSLGAQEEVEVRQNLLLYSVIRTLMSDLRERRLRSSLVPHPAGQAAEGRLNGDTSLLDAVIDTSKIGSIVWNKASGQWSESETVRNDRVVHLVKVCVDLAWSDAQQELQQ